MSFQAVSDCLGNVPGDQSLFQKSFDECDIPHQASPQSVRAGKLGVKNRRGLTPKIFIRDFGAVKSSDFYCGTKTREAQLCNF